MPDDPTAPVPPSTESAPIPPGRVPPHPGPIRDDPEPVRASAAPLPPTRPRTGGRKLPLDRILVAIEILLLIAVWQFLIGTLQLVNPVFLPPPSKIAGAIATLTASGAMVEAAVASLTNFAIGYGLAVVVGVGLGLVLGGSRAMGKLVAPLIWALYAMPLIAIRPMTTIWFGFGNMPIIFLVFLSALLPIALNTMAGVRTVDRSLLRAAKVFGASRLETYRKVVLPATVPFVLTGLRLAIVTAWIILIIAELVGAPRGFGQILGVATSRFRVDQAFAMIVVIVIISVSSVRILGYLERRVAVWRPGGST